MGVYVTRKCPKCGYAFERFVRKYVALGKPFEVCPTCRTIVLFNHINEWDLMSNWDKVKFIIIHTYTVLLYSMGVFILIAAASGLIRSGLAIFVIFIISVSIAFLISIPLLQKDIQESRYRMQDPEYQKELNEHLGLEFD